MHPQEGVGARTSEDDTGVSAFGKWAVLALVENCSALPFHWRPCHPARLSTLPSIFEAQGASLRRLCLFCLMLSLLSSSITPLMHIHEHLVVGPLLFLQWHLKHRGLHLSGRSVGPLTLRMTNLFLLLTFLIRPQPFAGPHTPMNGFLMLQAVCISSPPHLPSVSLLLLRRIPIISFRPWI